MLSKIKIRPIRLKGQICYQASATEGQKVLHKNYGRTELIEYVEKELAENFRQFQAQGAVTDGVVLVSKKGKMTIKQKHHEQKEKVQIQAHNRVKQYILKEVQKVYRSQGVDISDKHVEIIARRMISKVRIMDAGDTLFVPSTTVSLQEFTKGNRDVIIQGKKPAIGQPILLGITKAALETDSFLSAASFQETTRILTEASVKGKVDKLQGLKENVIIGKLIPAGTGAKEYMDVGYSLEHEFLDDDASEVLEEEFMD